MEPVIDNKCLCDGRYELKTKLGRGGMGQVFLANDLELNRRVAIKEAFRIEDEDVLKAALKEAQVLAGLRHPNLPAVYDHFVENETPYIVMEFIGGCNLNAIFEGQSNEASLSLREAFHSPGHIGLVTGWLNTMMDVVEFLHTREISIVHRDIKPANILVNESGELVLIDFGLVKVVPTQHTSKSFSTGILGFTECYSPLEQTKGEPTSTEADIYALCATFYHLFTTRKPLDVLERLTVIGETGKDPLTPAHLINPAVPHGISSMLYHGMTIGRESRPKSVPELRQFLPEFDTVILDDEHHARFKPEGFSRFHVELEGEQKREPERSAEPRKKGCDEPQGKDFLPERQPSDGRRSRFVAVSTALVMLIMVATGFGFFIYENSLYAENQAIVERLNRAAIDDFDTIENELGNYENARTRRTYFRWGLADVGHAIRKKIDAFADHKIEEYRAGQGRVSNSTEWKRAQQLLEKLSADEPDNKEIQANIAYLKGQQSFIAAHQKGADKTASIYAARRSYEEAIRLNPKFGDPYFMIALTYIYAKPRDHAKALENIELAIGNGFPYDKRTRAVKGDCLQELADATVRAESEKFENRSVNDVNQAHGAIEDLEKSLATVKEKYVNAKNLYEEAKGFGTVDRSLREVNIRLQKLDEGLDAVDKLHLLADVAVIAQRSVS